MRIGLIFLLVLSLACPVHGAPEKNASSSSTPPAYVPKDFDNGFKVAMEVIKEMGIEDDSAKAKRVNDIGYRVAQRAAPDMPNFSFRIVKMEEPNAFALPGGFIFVTTGMLDLDLNDDELAALLGHEITHVKNDHSHRMAKRQTLMNLLYQALVLGIAFGLKDSGGAYDPVTGQLTRDTKAEVLQGTEAFGLVFQELLLRGFSRDLEMEADHEGMIAASRAGFSSKGTEELFDKMRQRIYEAPGYGYWRTHPYLDERSDIARVLAPQFTTAKNPADATDFRKRTQQTFVKLLDREKDENQKRELRSMALHALPTGEEADQLRAWFIHDAESKETSKEPFFRDFGKLIHTYEENIAEMGQEGESGELLAKLQKNLAKLKQDRDEILPMYEEVLGRGNYDTETLQRFLSNFPDNPRVLEVKFRLAENYRILKKGPEAVNLYLEILNVPDASEWKEKSHQSLAAMMPRLQDLSSCFKVHRDAKNQELAAAAEDRMKLLAQTFDSLQNGYEFRRNYPSSDYDKQVRDQMNKLASDTLKQAKLYQGVGEYQKALDSYNQILRYCSDLPIADQVKDSIVDFQELSAVKG